MSDILRRCFVFLALAAAAMAALLSFLPAAGHDQLWFLLMAHRWLAGAPLYGPQIFDSNPPMVVWLSALVEQSAAVSHIATTLVAKTAVLALAGAIAFVSFRLLSRVGRPPHTSARPALLFGFVVLFLAIPARDLGQRDALAVLLGLPYVLAAARTANSSIPLGYPVLVGLLAGLGFCLKPQDALIAVVLELGLLLSTWRRERSFTAALRKEISRPEVPLLLLCGGLYLLAIRHFAPLYFSLTLPLVRETYWAIGGLSFAALLGQAPELIVLAGITAFLVLRWPPACPVTRVLLMAGAGALLAFFVQGTGWYYQQIPAIDLMSAALWLHLLDLERKYPLHPPHWLPAATGALCLLAVALTTHFSGYPFTRTRAFALTSPDPVLFAGLPAGTPVAILTTSVDEAMMPVEFFHLTWAQRVNNLWLLPAILRSEQPGRTGSPHRQLSPANLAALDALQHAWMVEDLERWRPQLVLVERCQDPAVQCQVLEDRHDNLLAWFKRDPAFAHLWRSYSLQGSDARFDAYTLLPGATPAH